MGTLLQLSDETAQGFEAVGNAMRLRAKDDLSNVSPLDFSIAAAAAGVGGARRYHQVAPDKTILSPTGSRFVVKGATMFDYLLVSYEARTDWSYRKIYQPGGKGPGTGVSEPTYYAPYVYVSQDHVRQTIADFVAWGGNLIRVSVEPAIRLASVSYTDPSDSVVYPSDPVMLDTIIEEASRAGVVVYLTIANEQQYSATGTASSDMITFLEWLIDRYDGYTNLWLCPANEMNATDIMASNGTTSTNPNVSNAANWVSKAAGYVSAIRTAGFEGPIGLNPTEYGYNLALVAAAIAANSTLANDPNLIIDVHQYSTGTDDFYLATGSSGQTDTLSKWASYAGQFCLMVGETGINNNLGDLDPNLNGSSSDLTLWGKLQTWMTQYLEYCFHFSEDKISGVIGHCWTGYIPGLAKYDRNAMQKNDGSFTTWGGIFRDEFVARAPGYRAWTPVFSPATGAFSNCVQTGRKLQVGKRVYVEAEANDIANGTAAGVLSLQLPIPPKGRTAITGVDISSGMPLTWAINPAAPYALINRGDGGLVQATGRILSLNGYYEAA